MQNPFYYGGHVHPDQFVGRGAELRRIFAGLEVAHTGQMQSFSVIGPRRIGKSSLLFYIANGSARFLEHPEKYQIAYVDLQSAECKTLDGLLRRILRELGAVARNKEEMKLEKFQDALMALKAGGHFPVICLDEFEELTHHLPEYPAELYDSWRCLMNANAVAFITASKSPLQQLAQERRYTSPFFNIFTHLTLGEFTDDEAMELINRCATSGLPFDDAESDHMSLFAGNHPYKLQLAGHLIFDLKARGQPIDWDKLRAEFDKQLEQVGLSERFSKRAAREFKNTFGSGFVGFPKMVGRAMLESVLRLNRDSFSETTAWLIGTGVLVLVLLVLFGLVRINWDDIWSRIERVRG